MFKFLTVKVKLILLCVFFSVGFAIFSSFAFNLLEVTKINGEIYSKIILSKDLIADILPPPEYIIESYLTSEQIVNETNPTK